MEERILDIISSFINKPVSELKTLGDSKDLWNSLQKVEIIIALEDEFDLSFSQEDIIEMNSISQITNKIRGKINNET